MMDLLKDLLLLGVVIALLIPAVTATDAEAYITVTTGDAMEYRGLRIATVDALDPLETKTSLVTLEGDNLTSIPRPAFGVITRVFDPASGTYHAANVTVTENKTLDGSALPEDYRIYTDRTIPNFTVNVPDRHGNVLLVKLPEILDEGINFTTFFRAAKEQGYFFTDSAILYSNTTGISAYGGIDVSDYDVDDLNFTLVRNEVDLSNFSTDGEILQNMMEAWPYTRPEAGEYLLTAVNYDSASETLHVLAAMPVLILDGNADVAWNGDDPYYQDRGVGATVSFEEGVNRTAYVLVRNDTTYDLTMRVDTEAFVNQPIPTTMADLVSLLQTAAGEASPVTYVLTPNSTPAGADTGSGVVIAEGYGLSGSADGPEVEIGAEALAALDPGTYSLYALGMEAGEIVVVDYREIEVQAASS
ncbi:MAG: hypothetical protein PHP43_01955 [Methanoculleus sp.]|nr:hypothetical protein [Methanoculleus sp.]